MKLTPHLSQLVAVTLACLLAGGSWNQAWGQVWHEGWTSQWRGHSKYRFTASHYPENSFYRFLYGANSQNQLWDNRLQFSAEHSPWDIRADYQLQWLEAEATEVNVLPQAATEDDQRRLFDLTHTLSEKNNRRLQHRLDRLSVGYSGEQWVWRAGRQVLSWGNGLMFQVMDFTNPFDPTALDTEYKTGDDMLYAQYLLDSGNDVQVAWVVRRNQQGSVDRREHTQALKYHHWLEIGKPAFGWLDGMEVDFLLARHYDETIIGLGAVRNIGDALWRADATLTDTDNETVFSLVTNLSYSWVWRDTNYNGALEYYYNGFGLDRGNYHLVDVQSDTALFQRLQRGEVFVIGQHYVAASASIELSPLWVASPTVFMNAEDQSALLQLGINHDLAQNWRAIAAVTIPLGPKNTDYGGIATGMGSQLSTTAGVFVQVGGYF